MELVRAKYLLNEYMEVLKPKCKRIEIVGSVRREHKFPNDIELLCIPKTIQIEDGLFDKKEIRDSEFIQLINSFPRVRGNGEGKYAKIMLLHGAHLDLFITTPEQWGLLMMIRTGSAEFSKRMVTEIKQRGYMSDDGYLKTLAGEIVPCYEERDFFKITNTSYVEPSLRVF